jgi:phosphohistidine phosphatase
MVKKLFLIRHAEAEDQQRGESDFGRSLTRTGMRGAALAGKYLKELEVVPDIFISSDAQRTRQTSEAIADQLKFNLENIQFDNDIYEASIRILLRVVTTTISEDKSIAIIVGHNPGISFLSEFLTGSLVGNVVPGGIVEINFMGISWPEVSQASGTLKGYFFPDTNT